MRLRRVRIDDVKGVEAGEVVFASDGVTIVEAPNESGKTTLLEAVDLLLTEKDSSTKKAVRDLKPVGRDVGSRVEVELTCGPYHLTCVKRFNKQKGTELTVHAPRPEQHTGAEAHDRLRAILEAEVDLALFEALRFRQGRGLDGVALGESNVIAARLDEAAGGGGAAGDDALLARVRDEYERYFTPKGSEGKVLREAAATEDDARARRDALAERLARLDEDVDELDRLQREHARLEEERRALGGELADHRARRERVSQLREHAARAGAAVTEAHHAHEDAARAARERAELAAALEDDGAERERLAARLAPEQERLDDLLQRCADADAAVEAAEREVGRARDEHEAATRAVDVVRLREERDRLADRRARVAEVLAQRRDADAFLADCALTDDLLAEIREAAEELRVAEATLAAGAPELTLTPHRELAAVVDDDPVALAADATRRWRVEDRLIVELEGVARVEVAAGTSLAGLRAAVDRARERRDAACRGAGVPDPAAAEELAARRREHERTLADAQSALSRALEGTTREQLEDRWRLVTDRLEALAADAPALPIDLEAAEDTVERTRERQRAAETALTDRRHERDALAGEGERRRRELLTEQARLEQVDERRARRRDALEAARAQCDDAALTTRCREREAALARARADARAIEDELDALDPETVELLARNAEQRAEDLDHRLQDNARRRTERQTRLDVVGEEGLGEQLATVEQELAHAEREHRRLRARATAAKVLHDELQAARDEAYRAYQQPLRELISRHGRVVFGDGVDVELDEELRVVRRTLGGDTLAWEHLSSGAKEQLAILSALAAARLAAEDGVPLVLDDALGYTDPDRLAALGAVLGAARDAQVIVLTCVADRYRHVGGATTVRLLDARPADRVDVTA